MSTNFPTLEVLYPDHYTLGRAANPDFVRAELQQLVNRANVLGVAINGVEGRADDLDAAVAPVPDLVTDVAALMALQGDLTAALAGLINHAIAKSTATAASSSAFAGYAGFCYQNIAADAVFTLADPQGVFPAGRIFRVMNGTTRLLTVSGSHYYLSALNGTEVILLPGESLTVATITPPASSNVRWYVLGHTRGLVRNADELEVAGGASATLTWATPRKLYVLMTGSGVTSTMTMPTIGAHSFGERFLIAFGRQAVDGRQMTVLPASGQSFAGVAGSFTAVRGNIFEFTAGPLIAGTQSAYMWHVTKSGEGV